MSDSAETSPPAPDAGPRRERKSSRRMACSALHSSTRCCSARCIACSSSCSASRAVSASTARRCFSWGYHKCLCVRVCACVCVCVRVCGCGCVCVRVVYMSRGMIVMARVRLRLPALDRNRALGIKCSKQGPTVHRSSQRRHGSKRREEKWRGEKRKGEKKREEERRKEERRELSTLMKSSRSMAARRKSSRRVALLHRSFEGNYHTTDRTTSTSRTTRTSKKSRTSRTRRTCVVLKERRLCESVRGRGASDGQG